MAKCPTCGADGADILLNKVYCTNSECQWFDETALEHLAKRVDGLLNKFIKDIRSLKNKDSDPDITPVWDPTAPD
jgi:hypothetical protein